MVFIRLVLYLKQGLCRLTQPPLHLRSPRSLFKFALHVRSPPFPLKLPSLSIFALHLRSLYSLSSFAHLLPREVLMHTHKWTRRTWGDVTLLKVYRQFTSSNGGLVGSSVIDYAHGTKRSAKKVTRMQINSLICFRSSPSLLSTMVIVSFKAFLPSATMAVRPIAHPLSPFQGHASASLSWL